MPIMQTPRATLRRSTLGTISLWIAALALGIQPALADGTAQALPFAQDWSNTGLITTSDDWSGVPGILGYRGDGLTSVTNVDPQTVLADGTSRWTSTPIRPARTRSPPGESPSLRSPTPSWRSREAGLPTPRFSF
jgi:hypothetical protein